MRFSIVTVCLNPGGYLKEAILSVIHQDFGDFEYLIVDGGSTDGSLDVIRRFAAADARIIWESSRDGGISEAMNRGLARARGEILSFLHADDRYADPTVLGVVDRSFTAVPQPLWVTGGIREIDAMGNEVRKLPVRRFSQRRLLRNNILYHPATFVSLKGFERVGGFDNSLRYAMDYDLWLRLGRISSPVRISRVLADFRVHDGSLSTTNRRAALEEEYAVRCRYAQGWFGRLGHTLYHSWRRRQR